MSGDAWTYLNESQVRYQRFHLLNDLGLSTSVKRLQYDVKHCLLLGLLLNLYVKIRRYQKN